MTVQTNRFRKGCEGITIPEVMVSCLIVGLLVLANLASVYNLRILGAKDAERAVVSGFMQHYVELVKALPFDQVKTNLPISGLYNGTGGSPRIVLPVASDWMNLTDANYQTFHPSLIWVTNRHPQMRVTLETSTVSGITHDKHIALEVRWDAPLGHGPQLTERFDVLRVKDL